MLCPFFNCTGQKKWPASFAWNEKAVAWGPEPADKGPATAIKVMHPHPPTSKSKGVGSSDAFHSLDGISFYLDNHNRRIGR